MSDVLSVPLAELRAAHESTLPARCSTEPADTARRVDPAGGPGRACAVIAQADLLAAWLSGLPPSAWRTPSVLPGWTFTELAEHLAMSLRATATPCWPTGPDKPVGVAGTSPATPRPPPQTARAGARPAPPVATRPRCLAGALRRARGGRRGGRRPAAGVGPGGGAARAARSARPTGCSPGRSRWSCTPTTCPARCPTGPPVELDRTALRLVTQACADLLADPRPGPVAGAARPAVRGGAVRRRARGTPAAPRRTSSRPTRSPGSGSPPAGSLARGRDRPEPSGPAASGPISHRLAAAF